jgi:hypothetical protein
MEQGLDEKLLKQALSLKTCVQIAKCARVLNLEKGTRRMTKENAVAYVGSMINPESLEVLREQDFRASQSLGLYAKWTSSKESLVVDALLSAFDRLAATAYTNLDCAQTAETVTPKYGAFDGGSSDCPPGFRQKERGKGCCLRFEDVFGSQITDEDLEQIPSERERHFVRALFPKADSPRITLDREGKLLMLLARDVQARAVEPLGALFQSLIDATKQEEACVDSKSWIETIKDISWNTLLNIDLKSMALRGLGAMLELMASILGKLGKLVLWGLDKIAGAAISVGQQLAGFILQDPLHARMILAVCTSLRNRVADRVVEWCLNNHILVKIESEPQIKPPVSELNRVLFNQAHESLETIAKTGVLDPFNVMGHLTQNDSVRNVMFRVAEVGARAVGGMFAMVGGTLAAEVGIELTKTVLEYSTTAAVESIKFSAYQNNIHEAFWILIDLFDIRTAMRRHPMVYLYYPKTLQWLGGGTVKHKFDTSEQIRNMVAPKPEH